PYGFNSTQIENLISCLNGNAGKQFFSDSHVLNLDRKHLEISSVKKTNAITEKIIPALGNYVFNAHQLSVKEVQEFPSFLSDKNNIYVDGEKLIFPLKLRYWQQGDIFKPFGMEGFKKLSDY